MFEIKLAGENAVIIYFKEDISPTLSQKIAFYRQLLMRHFADWIIDATPSYQTLLLSYRLDSVRHADFCQQLEEILNQADFSVSRSMDETVTIPVYYGLDVGLDLTRLLSEKQLELDQFIHLHSQQLYSVYAIGFSPAFAFLGKVDEHIQCPRLPEPRLKVPAGSVGIADNQTAVYPIETPGGWNIIGRTPINLSLSNPDNLHRFQVGQQIRFKAINRQQFVDLGGQL